MHCQKCNKEIPEDSTFCIHCGAKQNLSKKPKQKGNGLGCVYQLPNKIWRAKITLGYDMVDGKTLRKAKTKSGFRTKRQAEEYLPTLHSQPVKKRSNHANFGVFSVKAETPFIVDVQIKKTFFQHDTK